MVIPFCSSFESNSLTELPAIMNDNCHFVACPYSHRSILLLGQHLTLFYNLGQNKMEQQTPIPPNQGWSRARGKNAPFSHPWFGGEGGSRFSIYFVQDCSYYCIWLTVSSLSPHNLHVCGMFCLSMIDFIVFVLNSWSWAAVINPCVSFFNWPLRNHLHIYVMLFSIHCVP